MANIILSRPFTQQPQYVCEIDWNNPLSRGIIFFYVGNNLRGVGRNGSNGWPATEGAPNFVGSPQGLSVDFTGSQKLVYTGFGPGSSPSENTMFALAMPTVVTADNEYTAIGSTTDNSLPLFRIELLGPTSGTPGWKAQYRGNGGDQANITQSVAATAGRMYSVASTFKSGSGAKTLYVDGKFIGQATDDIGAISLASVDIGVLQREGAAQYFTGRIPLGVMWNRVLLREEIAELSSNPWQIFRPRTQVLYFEAGGGGGGSSIAAISNFYRMMRSS